jgi:hypothetical protein
MKLILIIVLGCLGAFVVLQVCWSFAFRWSRRKHHGMTRDAFLHYFTERGMSAEVVVAVYDYYRSQVKSRTFGVSPQDEIAVLFNQAEEDVEDDFTSILKKLGLSMPSDDAWDAWGRSPVRTVEQMVAAVVWASEHQPA